MTENEKLRSLLAEAQSGLMCDRYREAWERCDCAVCAVKTRIDAALAEPVGDALEWQTAITKALSESQERLADEVREARRERDEARAEAARRREEGEGLLQYAFEAYVAYQRGAEAMREAAATLVSSNATGWASVGDMEAAIRALPLPEDKP